MLIGKRISTCVMELLQALLLKVKLGLRLGLRFRDVLGELLACELLIMIARRGGNVAFIAIGFVTPV